MRDLDKADRLAEIAQRIGFSLWQLQELEGVTAQYFVLLAQAKKSMGLAAANELLEKARRRTFGAMVGEITKTHLLPQELEGRFVNLLAERNWLVHNSRASNRDAVESDEGTINLVARIDAIAGESLTLLREVAVLMERYAKQHGVTQEYIDNMASTILQQWRSGVDKDD